MVNQRRGARFSAADGYLKPARRRRNLTVLTGAHATRVLFDGPRAVGVEYVRDGVTATARTAHEVILSGGSVNTPQLLMLSGIGDRDELAAHDIPLVAHSPEVGKNLQDHLVAGLIVDAPDDTLFAAERLGELAKYLVSRQGMLTSNVAEAFGYVKSDPSRDLPDLELIFAPIAFIDQGLTTHTAHGLTIGAILSQPISTGTVSLASADPFDKPHRPETPHRSRRPGPCGDALRPRRLRRPHRLGGDRSSLASPVHPTRERRRDDACRTR